MFSATPCTTIDSGYRPVSFAPARYSGTCGPGTFEITTFIARSEPARRERPYSEARPLSSQGEPSDGKSFGIRLPNEVICAFIARVPAMMCSRR